MEVHHHSHTPRKKWSHYFWEFLMLFLAVFCGFLAEYQLEHTIEHQREKKYARSLLEDLKRDTADLANDIRWWNIQMNRIDAIHQELDKPASVRNTLLLYQQAAFMRMYNAFEYHDRTIDQLKNAGNFRLIRKKTVTDSLIDYDATVRSTLRNIEGGATTIFMTLNFLQNKLFDSKYFQFRSEKAILDSLQKLYPPRFAVKSGNETELFEYTNHLYFYKGNMSIRVFTIRNLLNKAGRLIEMIQKEYRIK